MFCRRKNKSAYESAQHCLLLSLEMFPTNFTCLATGQRLCSRLVPFHISQTRPVVQAIFQVKRVMALSVRFITHVLFSSSSHNGVQPSRPYKGAEQNTSPAERLHLLQDKITELVDNIRQDAELQEAIVQGFQHQPAGPKLPIESYDSLIMLMMGPTRD